jgi:hypothetical protein
LDYPDAQTQRALQFGIGSGKVIAMIDDGSIDRLCSLTT